MVWRDLHFMFWPRPTPDDAHTFPYLTSTVITREGDAQAWKQLGRRVLGTIFHRGKYIADDLDRGADEEVVKRLYEEWSAPLKEGLDGIFIDEFGAYPTERGRRFIQVRADALAMVREHHPDAWIFPAIGGALLPEQALACKFSDSIAMIETYPDFVMSTFGTHRFDSYLKQRVETVRHADLIFERGYRHGEEANNPASWARHGAIILLSLNTVGRGILEEPAVARLEKYVRQIKREAPEMPGIAFYGSAAAMDYFHGNGLMTAAENMIERYYIKPVVSLGDVYVDDYDARAGTANQVHVEVRNFGGMDAEQVRIAVHARHLISNEVETIGTLDIARLGTGFRSLIKQDPERSYEFQEVGGDTYVALEGSNTIFQARSTQTLDWTPRQDGPYQITAAIRHSPQYTVLDGVQDLQIVAGPNVDETDR